MDKALLFDKIEAYINGALSPDDRKAFEIEMANNDDLAIAVQMHRLEHDGMERILETDLRKKMQTWATETPPPSVSVREGLPKLRFSKGMVLAGLGLLALFVACTYIFMSNLTMRMPHSQPSVEPIRYDTNGVRVTPQVLDTSKTPVVVNENAPSVKTPEKPIFKGNSKDLSKKTDNIAQNNAPQTNGTGQTTDDSYTALAEEVYQEPSSSAFRGSNVASALSEASVAFDDKDYQKAVDLLKNIPNTDAQYAKSLVITGHAYFKLKQYKKAIPAFQSLIKVGKPYAEDAEWYLILCYLTDYSHNKNNVDSNLKHILSDSFHLHYKQAQDLKSKLK